jgi:response regulator RpfG family c-di-GMP phosphodiesterase
VAKEMGLDPVTCEEIYYGGLLSDLGRIGVSGSIRPASSGPGNGEPAEIRRVPLIGKEIQTPSPDLGSVADIIYTYHECYDGEGREGLRGEQIPIGARIVAVAVALEELTSGGSHGPAMDLKAALESLREGAGTRFDPGVVNAFERALGDSQVSVSLDGRVDRS